MTIEFQGWPKTPRLMRDIVITEKLDGTNAAIGIVPLEEGEEDFADPGALAIARSGDIWYKVYAQSRTRLIMPGKDTDNFGFAGWVERNVSELVDLLGPGLHYGEWWGNGIQRNYGQDHKRFSLFNTHKYGALTETELPIDTVPTLYHGPFSTGMVRACLEKLRADGSSAAPGFMNPEGIIVYHSAARQSFKVTLDKNDAGKWEV